MPRSDSWIGRWRSVEIPSESLGGVLLRLPSRVRPGPLRNAWLARGVASFGLRQQW
jgi:hypothetical protein